MITLMATNYDSFVWRQPTQPSKSCSFPIQPIHRPNPCPTVAYSQDKPPPPSLMPRRRRTTPLKRRSSVGPWALRHHSPPDHRSRSGGLWLSGRRFSSRGRRRKKWRDRGRRPSSATVNDWWADASWRMWLPMCKLVDGWTTRTERNAAALSQQFWPKHNVTDVDLYMTLYYKLLMKSLSYSVPTVTILCCRPT